MLTFTHRVVLQMNVNPNAGIFVTLNPAGKVINPCNYSCNTMHALYWRGFQCSDEDTCVVCLVIV